MKPDLLLLLVGRLISPQFSSPRIEFYILRAFNPRPMLGEGMISHLVLLPWLLNQKTCHLQTFITLSLINFAYLLGM